MALPKRNANDKIIAGVCSGLAPQFGIDAAMMRLVFILAFLGFGIGPLIYIILWVLMQGE